MAITSSGEDLPGGAFAIRAGPANHRIERPYPA